MSYLGDFVITVWRQGPDTQGPRGRVPGAWTADHTIGGCLVQSLKGRFASSEAETAAADFITSNYLLHLPTGSDLVGTDQVSVPGIPYRLTVVGDPGLEPDFSGRIDHIEVELTRFSG